MPVIRVTLIEGYDEAVRDRLLEGYSAVTRTVLEAVPDGVTVAIEEVKQSNYRRGNQRKHPKAPPPPPEQIVRDFLGAMERRDLAAAKAMLASDFTMVFPGSTTFTKLEELIDWARPRYQRIGKVYERFDAVPGMENAVVYCSGTLEGVWPDGTAFSGIRFIDRFTVRGGLLVDQKVWNDLDAILRQA
ncbi:nuclear transport factor 2 family protein [Ferrovibrio sp.]|uniref:nuclear transport factor 2 family protein n=1 Tax=Ferrovibrio sp. TaxID=1917215 RepID=UPI000CAD2F79|nr:nuclear transport factor 2 family protein [Ferrovibrio sp.]PJI43462.1 MAG: tautomerase [Ferrovibrio sp.]